MKIKCNHQTIEVKNCKKFKDRLFGMMGKKRPLSYGLYFPNCSSLHTCFMRQAIDIIMVDKSQKVVAFYPNVKPWHFVRSKKACACYEFSKGVISPVTIGSKITIL